MVACCLMHNSAQVCTRQRVRPSAGLGFSEGTMSTREKVYIGWKEIAERMEVKERTARQWAKKEGLPVRVRVDVFRMTEAAVLKWLSVREVPYPEYAETKRVSKKKLKVLQAA